MNLLQRHIFASVLFSCAMAAGIFTFVLILGSAFRDLLGYMLAGQLTPEVFTKLLLLLVPSVGIHALPIGMLTGVLLVLGRMSAQQEITAMRAAGLGLGYVARPILVIAAVGVGLSMALNFYYMPKARTLYRTTINDAVRKNPLSMIVEKTFIRDFPDMVIYAGQKNGGDLTDVWLWRLDKKKRVTDFMHAKTAHAAYDEDANVLKVVLFDTFSDRRNPKSLESFANTDGQGSMGEVPVDISLDSIFGQRPTNKKASNFTLGELLEKRDRLAKDNASVSERMKVSVALNEKSADSFAILAFTLLAIPLGIKISRKETSANLGIALVMTLSYYFINVMVSWLDRSPSLRPDLWLWLSPVLFISVGIWMFRRVERI